VELILAANFQLSIGLSFEGSSVCTGPKFTTRLVIGGSRHW
jgi:hypothetical protein